MKRLLIGLMVAAVAAIGFGGVGAFASANGGLKDFGTGAVTITSANSATIDNLAGQYGGVYVQSKSQSGELIGDPSLSFSFTSTGDVAGGAPRFSIPINTSGPSGGAGSVAGYAFLDVRGCDPTAINGSTVTVSTSAACRVFFGTSISGYPDWATFASQNPTYRIAQGHFPFIIADQPGHYTVNDIKLT